MPSVIRRSVDPSAGHCFTPRAADTGSCDVIVNNARSVRGFLPITHPSGSDESCNAPIATPPDHYPNHSCGNSAHDGVAREGSPTVFVNGYPYHRDGDDISCGDVANNGSPNVFANSGTGVSYMVDNTVPYNKFLGTDGPANDEAQPTTTPFEFHNHLHDDEESTAGLPPKTNPGSYIEPDPIEEDQVPPATQAVTPHTCATIEALSSGWRWQDDECPASPLAPPCTVSELNAFWPNFAQNFQISTNYTLWDLTSGPIVSTYKLDDVGLSNGLSQKQILQNLCFLAETIIEPLRTLYGPTFTVNSVFRRKSGGSQHNKGQACDIQFPNFTGQQYWDRAKEIKDDINFDQFIMEYAGRNPWFHISANPSGHRNVVLTQTGPGVFKPGLIRLT